MYSKNDFYSATSVTNTKTATSTRVNERNNKPSQSTSLQYALLESGADDDAQKIGIGHDTCTTTKNNGIKSNNINVNDDNKCDGRREDKFIRTR